jgi:hypothetical protein
MRRLWMQRLHAAQSKNDQACLSIGKAGAPNDMRSVLAPRSPTGGNVSRGDDDGLDRGVSPRWRSGDRKQFSNVILFVSVNASVRFQDDCMDLDGLLQGAKCFGGRVELDHGQSIALEDAAGSGGDRSVESNQSNDAETHGRRRGPEGTRKVEARLGACRLDAQRSRSRLREIGTPRSPFQPASPDAFPHQV